MTFQDRYSTYFVYFLDRCAEDVHVIQSASSISIALASTCYISYISTTDVHYINNKYITSINQLSIYPSIHQSLVVFVLFCCFKEQRLTYLTFGTRSGFTTTEMCLNSL